MGVAVAVYQEAGRVVAESEESRLIARSVAGDRAAQEALVRQYQDQVYRLAYGLLGNAEDARDATQEALIAMLRSLRTFRGHSRFLTWLYRLTTNVCLMQRRRHRARTRLLTDTPLEFYDAPEPGPDPESIAMSREVQVAVRECLRRLPAEFRAVVVMRELESLSYEEIAEILQVPLGTVQSRLSRGRRLLREALLADERVSSLYGQPGAVDASASSDAPDESGKR
jgi:RNA polymerase sigma-70 factor (ECF subfamily)